MVKWGSYPVVRVVIPAFILREEKRWNIITNTRVPGSDSNQLHHLPQVSVSSPCLHSFPPGSPTIQQHTDRLIEIGPSVYVWCREIRLGATLGTGAAVYDDNVYTALWYMLILYKQNKKMQWYSGCRCPILYYVILCGILWCFADCTYIALGDHQASVSYLFRYKKCNYYISANFISFSSRKIHRKNMKMTRTESTGVKGYLWPSKSPHPNNPMGEIYVL